MSYLLDTNVVSELRKKKCDPRVTAWFDDVAPDEIFLSVLTIGELRKGVELVRRRDKTAAQALDSWLQELTKLHSERILEVNRTVADLWGRFNAPDPLPIVDGFLAATATVHGLTLVTRNIRDVDRTGVSCLNPFL